MRLRDLLPPEHIFAPLAARSLTEALSEMVGALAAAGEVGDARALERTLFEGRGRAIVPVGERAVLPHHRTDAVERLVLALGAAPEPLDARDLGLTVRPELVALILAPVEASTLYLQTLSTLARLFRRDDVVDAIVRSRSPAEVLHLSELADVKVQPRLTVRDMMGHRRAIAPGAPVRSAVDMMVDMRVKAIPVVGEKGEVLGIVTEWDVMRALLPQVPRTDERESPSLAIPPDLRVRDIMTRSVLCISEEMGLDEAANLMINKDVEQFPVVAEGKLTGFLSRADIIRKLFGR
ncbi:MAG TPA: CBS domain-containing protein [Longimicrobiales bacterium]|nr:CBS domain-containing protein [Longimicrobiales bacterium]